jgi:hypothetical protein
MEMGDEATHNNDRQQSKRILLVNFKRIDALNQNCLSIIKVESHTNSIPSIMEGNTKKG